MIYLFAGDDTKKKLLNYENFLKTLPAGADVFSISRNTFDPVRVESFYSGASLFSPISVVIFESILEREDMREFFSSILSLMSASQNYFIFLEGALPKVVTDAFKKARAEINIFEQPKQKENKFDNFLIANAFAGKDKLSTWVYFRQAVEDGASLEAIAGILFWKIKDMILRGNFAKFSEAELKTCAARISYLLPEARKEGRDAEIALEKFLLEAF